MAFAGYLLNCFLLLVPVLIWNFIFYKKLPELFQNEKWDSIRKPVIITENIIRFCVFIFPLFIKLEVRTELQFSGLVIYEIGLLVYFGSWLLQIFFQNTRWSKSLIGFMAPAFTSIIWLAGIGLIGRSLTFALIYDYRYFLLLSFMFVIIHSMHAYLVYKKYHVVKK
jgi:hypothetical protein